MSKTLLLYYSFEGNTHQVVSYLKKEMMWDAERIILEKEHASKGFSKYLWGARQVLMRVKPDIKPLNVNLDDYTTIVVATPIWAGTYAPAIATVLLDPKFVNKHVHYLYTHEDGCKNAEKIAKEVFNQKNKYGTAFGISSVKKNFETIKEMMLAWTKQIEQKKYD